MRFIPYTLILFAFAVAGCQSYEAGDIHADSGWQGESHLPEDVVPALSVESDDTKITVLVTGDMVQYVDFYFEKEPSPRATATKAPFEFTLPFTGLSEGQHELRVVAGIEMLGEVSTLTRYVGFTVPTKNNQTGCDQVGTNEFVGCYYSGKSFNNFVFSRTDKEIKFDFGNGSPDSRIAANEYSIRWRGNFNFAEAGTYQFTAAADDGVRVLVDGKMVIDEWRNQAVTTFTAQVNLTKGNHRIDVEYYEDHSSAEVSVSWALGGSTSPAPQPTPSPSDGTYGARPVPRSKTPTANDTFVSPSGSGTACTQQNPCSLTTGLNQGSFIWMMSGTYNVSSQFALRNNKTLEALEPQKAIIDFGGRTARLMVDNNTVLRNVVVRRAAGHSGIHVFGNNNLIEGVISERHYYSGIAIWCGGYDNATNPSGGSFNTIKDTIVRYNSENCAKSGGTNNCSDSDADGISVSCGRGNRITHSEAIFNADDGFDVWRSYESTVENSISTRNGYDPADLTRRIGNGNGYKMGGPLGTGNRHTFINNWSYDNRTGDFSYNSGYGFLDVRGNVCGQGKTPCSPR